VLFADERGRLVDGDQALAVCALDLQARGLLAGGTVVGTVMSNYGLELALRKAGIVPRAHPRRRPRRRRGDAAARQRARRRAVGHIVFSGLQTTATASSRRCRCSP